MSRLTPFRALRPAPPVAPEVSSVPYDVVSADEARVVAQGHPLSFLRVTRSEIELPAGTDPYSAPVYQRARQLRAPQARGTAQDRPRAGALPLPAAHA